MNSCDTSIRDDGSIRLSWRRDGQLFACSSLDKRLGHRVVRIWDRDLELQFTSPVTAGLEASLSWKPSSEVIALSQQRFQKHYISFIEKNGLLLSDFLLPFPSSSFVIKDVRWSLDSTVLLIWGHTDSSQFLMLWTMSNHHWYLKQTFEFPNSGRRISVLDWDPVLPLCLHIIFDDGTYACWKWMWTVCRSCDGSVAVIDGKQVLVTPFNTTVIPPPMSGE